MGGACSENRKVTLHLSLIPEKHICKYLQIAIIHNQDIMDVNQLITRYAGGERNFNSISLPQANLQGFKWGLN